MRIVILDGRIGKADKSWNKYIAELAAELESRHHRVKHYILEDLNIHHCIGCFGCWVKTPGLCVFKDDAGKINHEVIHADLLLWASPLVLGYPTHHLKKVMDRSIPLVHPYLTLVQGEFHHVKRYEKYPRAGLLVKPQEGDDERQLSIVYDLFARTCLNFKTWLSFAETTETPVNDLVSSIENAEQLCFESQLDFRKKPLAVIEPPKKILVINGSHRGKNGNTPLILQKVAEGFASIEGNTIETLHLVKMKNKGEFVNAFRNAQCVLIGFALYTDAMTGLVKELFDELEEFEGVGGNPPLAFMVQSGFPEAAHSRYIEQYLITLAERLDSPYLGSLVRGGAEGVRSMPESRNRKMFSILYDLGRQLALNGSFDEDTLASFVGVEQYPPNAQPVINLMLPFINMVWDRQLLANKVYRRRFARPYASPPE